MPRWPKRTDAERFEAHVDRTGLIPAHRPELGQCHVWAAYVGANGYGMFSVAGKPLSAHRFAYEQVNGPIPDGLWVLHRCDNRPCVRADHLFLGTNTDNVRDMYTKGRAPVDRGAALAQAHQSWLQGKTRCLRGHPYAGGNVRVDGRGYRSCKACDRMRHNARNAASHGGGRGA